MKEQQRKLAYSESVRREAERVNSILEKQHIKDTNLAHLKQARGLSLRMVELGKWEFCEEAGREGEK